MQTTPTPPQCPGLPRRTDFKEGGLGERRDVYNGYKSKDTGAGDPRAGYLDHGVQGPWPGRVIESPSYTKAVNQDYRSLSRFSN